MKNLICASILTFVLFLSGKVSAQNEDFTMRVVNTGYQLNSAWELLWGPDDSLWVTENSAYKVSRIDPATGAKSEIVDLSSKRNFTSPPKWPQGGLMGLVLHPSMYSEWPNPTKPYVYLAYVYQYNSTPGCTSGNGACNFKTKIVRYNYDRATHSFSNETVIINTLDGSNDHNSGRLTIGNVGGTPYLFYTIGDMGAGQFNNISRTNNAQTQNVLEGKILRFNLEEDGDAAAADKWIPNDNPYSFGGKKTPVWSWGHRNAQGIVMGSNGILYSSEQQDKSDDEVNIISKGNNYGWPKVSGYCDGNYNGLKLANQTVISEQNNGTTLNAHEPIYTFFTEDDPASLGTDYLTWPTVACSSIDIYEKNVIPNWNKSLLVTSLKAGQIFRLKLSEDGLTVVDTSTIPAMRNQGRYRDIAMAPDGKKFYVACDISGQTSGPTGSYNGGGNPPTNAGRILEFTYTGAVMAIHDDTYTYVRNSIIKLYPNPATDRVLVQSVKSTTMPLFYYLYDITGKVVKQGKSYTDMFAIDVRLLSRGVYVMKIFNGYGMNVFTDKVTLQ